MKLAEHLHAPLALPHDAHSAQHESQSRSQLNSPPNLHNRYLEAFDRSKIKVFVFNFGLGLWPSTSAFMRPSPSI